MEVRDELNVDDAVASLAEVRQIAVFVHVAGAHHDSRRAVLPAELRDVVANGGAHIRAELARCERAAGAEADGGVDDALQLRVDSRLINDDLLCSFARTNRLEAAVERPL